MHADRRALRTALADFAQRSTPLALLIVATDLMIYGLCVLAAMYFEPVLLKVLAVIAAGVAISALFVVGHDAAHGAFTDSKRLNGIIGRIAFLPALHNYSLWQVVHNRLHHHLTNLKGVNSWSPMSLQEFRALPRWRRALERLYRTPLGLALYYLVERWWADKFFPRRRVVRSRRAVFWGDFALLAGFLVAMLTLLALAGARWFDGAGQAIVWGFVLPYLVWNAAMGFTVYAQHTHPRVAWFSDETQWESLASQHRSTPYIVFPRWYGLISHDIMEHTAHHVAPKIPLYNLRPAQQRLVDLLGDEIVQERFSLAGFFKSMVKCKLYDYENHFWLDFAGRPTTECTITGAPIMAEDTTTAAQVA